MAITTATERIRTIGGRVLRGRIAIGGAKNAALPAMAAALLTEEECVLENVPLLEDVVVMTELLRALGAEVDLDTERHRVRIRAAEIESFEPSPELVARMRASFLVTGPLLARFGRARSIPPGGCQLGSRPVDVDLRGFRKFGAQVEVTESGFELRSGRLRGCEIYMDYPSHTGTENLLMAACLAQGTTTILNAAAEPEIVNLGQILQDMGARISGLGTSRIVVQGVDRLRGYRASVLPDRLEAGTLAIAAAITHGEVILDHVREADMAPLTHKLREAGAEVWWSESSMLVRAPGPLYATEIQALPFPGFPTDLQAAFAVLMTQAQGRSRIFERVFNDRLRYTSELQRMGARIELIDRQQAIIEGHVKLQGTAVRARDIRSGACLVLAGLVAEGETIVLEAHHLRRGYEDLVGKLAALGADIHYA